MVQEKLCITCNTELTKNNTTNDSDKYKNGTQFQTGLPIIYMRELDPDYCIAFDSPEGRKLFRSAMVGDYMNIYFKLAQNFRTQDNSMMCSSGSIAMVLNALGVDPHRMWKYPWRWYDEYMLCACIEPDYIMRNGMGLATYTCICRTNKVQVDTFLVSPQSTVQQFRESVRQSCSSYDTVLVANYSRAALGQTGTGHYSPIGGYNEEEDKVLIMDIARFKLPPHWVSVEVLYSAMACNSVNRRGDSSDMPRGYLLVRKQEANPSITIRYPNNTMTVLPHVNLVDSRFFDLKEARAIWGELMNRKSEGSLSEILRQSIQCIVELSRGVFMTRPQSFYEANWMRIRALTVPTNNYKLFPAVKAIADRLSNYDLKAVVHFMHWIFSFISHEEANQATSAENNDNAEIRPGEEREHVSQLLTFMLVTWPYRSHYLFKPEEGANYKLMMNLVQDDVSTIPETRRQTIQQQIAFAEGIFSHLGHEVEFLKEETCFD